MKNLKDTLSTICGFIIAVAAGVKLNGVVLPATIANILDGAAVLSIAIVGYLQGKNPNGSTKVIDPSTGQQTVGDVPPSPIPPIVP
jgi:hypothetical protein